MNPLAKLAAAFPNPEIHPATIAVYADALKDLDPRLLMRAVDSLIATSEHFPRVAAIRESARRLKVKEALEKDAQERRKQLGEAPHGPPPGWKRHFDAAMERTRAANDMRLSQWHTDTGT